MAFENWMLREIFGPKEGRGNKELEENPQWGASWPALFIKYYSGAQVKKNEIGGACSTYGRGDIRTTFWWGNLNKRDCLEDLGVGVTVILKRIFMKQNGGVDRTDLAEDRDKWRAFV